MFSLIVKDIWSARELLVQFVQRDLKLRYRQAIMGFAWALFLPALTVGAGLVFRSAMSSQAPGSTVLSIGGIAIRSWAWTFFAGALNFGTISVLANAALVTKIYFPREVLPLSAVLTQGADSLVGLGVLLIAGPWLGFHWSWQLLWFPVLAALLVVLTSGLVFILSCANLFFRDVKYIVQVLLTFGIFFTPVFIDASSYSPRIARLMMLNPLAPILGALQRAITNDGPMLQVTAHWNPWYLLYAAVVALVTLPIGMIAFRQGAAFFAEYY
jgi:lipopolysaccharide transport system permease protein